MSKPPPGLGPTGRFPQGKLNGHDEGEIEFAIGEKDGKLVIAFGAPVAWIGMSPQEGCELAAKIWRHASRLARERGDIVTIELT